MKNHQLIEFCASHYCDAFINVYGSVTMIERFFHSDYVEYHNVTTFAECRKYLGY